MKSYLLAVLSAFISTLIVGRICIPLLKKIKAKQTILKYVEEHKEKNGTPTMGGLFFIIPSVICFFAVGGFDGRMANVSVVIGLAFMLVGFIDDFLKIKLKRNEGLKPYQKIIFQATIAVLAGLFVYDNGITVFHIPFTRNSVDLKWLSAPFVALIFIAVTNCVNLTDGLDGLAANVSAVYLVSSIALISLQISVLNHMYLKVDEYEKLNILSAALIGGLLAFLVYNTHRAKVFMGDTGSLSLGGFLGSISIFSSNSLFIPITGIMFVLSGISVIVQVAYFKRRKKRVFLMAPLHHHFQLKGHSEAKISFCYAMVTLIFGILAVFAYL